MADKKPERVPSAAEVDLEARLADDFKGESDLGIRSQTVQPNPLGDEDYVGTDAIYQNHANDTEEPLAAKSGVDKKAEAYFNDQFDLSEVDKDLVVDDSGLGGKAVLTQSAQTQPDASDVTVGAGTDVIHSGDQATATDTPASPPAPPEPSTNS